MAHAWIVLSIPEVVMMVRSVAQMIARTGRGCSRMVLVFTVDHTPEGNRMGRLVALTNVIQGKSLRRMEPAPTVVPIQEQVKIRRNVKATNAHQYRS